MYNDLIGITGDGDDAEEEIVASSEAADKLPSEGEDGNNDGERNHQESALNTKVLTKQDSELTHVVGVDSLHGGYQAPDRSAREDATVSAQVAVDDSQLEDAYDAEIDRQESAEDQYFRKRITKLLALEEQNTLYMDCINATILATPTGAGQLMKGSRGNNQNAARSRRDSILTPVYENVTAKANGGDRRPSSQQNYHQLNLHQVSITPKPLNKLQQMKGEQVSMGLPSNLHKFINEHSLMHKR